MMHGRTRWAGVALGLVAALALAGCGGGTVPSAGTPQEGDGPLTVWAHKGNAPAEAKPLEDAVKAFNAAHPRSPVTVKFIPEDSYTQQVSTAPDASLPDILDVDGPSLAGEVRKNRLVALDGLVAGGTASNQTAAIRAANTLNGRLYRVNQFNGAIGIYANKKLLDAAGVTYPTSVQDVWTAEEFTAAVKLLAQKNTVLPGKSLDLKLNYGKGGLTGEFGTFAYSPLLWSAGADLFRGGRATGTLNSPEAVRVLQAVASWKPYVTPNTDDTDFRAGRVALSYVGHWTSPDYLKDLGSDLLALPLPDFGHGTKGGTGTWGWSVTKNSKHQKAAAAFLDLLATDQYVNATVAVNGGVPATKTALATSKQYGKGGPLHLWGDLIAQSEGHECASGGSAPVPDACGVVARGLTAGYTTISREFSNALDAAFKGGDPQAVLDKAASSIDADFADHDGYQ